MENPEYKTLIKENKTLHDGMRGGVKSLYEEFYAEEYISDDIYHTYNREDDSMVDKLVTALQDRVKYDCKAFKVIINVLRKTVSMGALADILEERLSKLQEENRRNMETKDRNMKQLEERQAQENIRMKKISSESHIERPTDLGTRTRTALYRDVVNTGPAAGYGHGYSPLNFQKSGGLASSVGADVPSNSRKKNWYSPENGMEKSGFSPRQPTELEAAESGLRDVLSALNLKDDEFITGLQEKYPLGGGGVGGSDRTEGEEMRNEIDDRGVEETGWGGGGEGEVRFASDNTCKNSIILGNKSIICKSNSSEGFKTARSSPEPSADSELGRSVSNGGSKDCNECFKLRRAFSELYKRLQEMKERGEIERTSNHSQVTAFNQDLNRERLDNFVLRTDIDAYHSRHQEQEAIIFRLNSTIDSMGKYSSSQEHESEKVQSLTAELERVSAEKKKEREEKHREKEDKERERREKERERSEKEQEKDEKWKEREEKEREIKKNAALEKRNTELEMRSIELQRKNTELEMQIKQMFHRANSLQCGNEDSTLPFYSSSDDQTREEGARKDEEGAQSNPASSLRYSSRPALSDSCSTYVLPQEPYTAPSVHYTAPLVPPQERYTAPSVHYTAPLVPPQERYTAPSVHYTALPVLPQEPYTAPPQSGQWVNDQTNGDYYNTTATTTTGSPQPSRFDRTTITQQQVPYNPPATRHTQHQTPRLTNNPPPTHHTWQMRGNTPSNTMDFNQR